MKRDLPFFSHDNNARNHPKMRALIAQFGWAGYGQFWALNEMISQACEARLDLSKKINRAATAGELRMSPDQFDAFLAFLSDPEYDLVNLQDGILTTDRTQEDYELVRKSRERDRSRKVPPKGIPAENGEIATENADFHMEKYTEQSRAEQIERAAAARAENRDVEIDPDAFASWLRADRRVTTARNPGGMFQKLSVAPDILAEYRALIANPPPPPEPKRSPPPDTCPHCKAKILVPTPGPGEARTAICHDCRASWTYDEDWNTWTEDTEQLVPVPFGLHASTA
jgi:hypothetical protein